jgi:hypothetical protein
MTEDDAFLHNYATTCHLLLDASGGEFVRIPENYASFLAHDYSDGSISALPAIHTVTGTDLLSDGEINTLLSQLAKVNPEEWPELSDIANIDANSLLSTETNTTQYNFVEDNLSTAAKVDSVLTQVLEETFKAKVHSIRDNKGSYPSPSNNFLQQSDGTFAGTFTHDTFKFYFEIAPTESEWICTYRLSERSLDTIPKKTKNTERDGKVKMEHRKIRSRGW